MTAEMQSLDELLAAASAAEPGDRINYRNAVAAHGEAAIDAMADWLGDRRLCAFAIRVLERVGAQDELRQACVDALVRTDRSDWPAYLHEDADRALSQLGFRPRATRGSAGSRAASDRPPGLPGRPGRGYWVMRTSPEEKPYLWAEAMSGRLRQGWGVADEQDLNVIADAVQRGIPLTGLQRESRLALRMLTSWLGGMHVGDVVVAPHLPHYGHLSVFKVVDSYEWSPGPPLKYGERFGHVLPVELLRGEIGRWSSEVTDALRYAMRSQTRLFNIGGCGGDVERLIGGEVGTDRHREHWTEQEYETLFGQYPPQGDRPTEVEADDLGLELGRTTDAILWQWDDGAAYVQGRSASTTSDVLKTWLDRQTGQP